MRKEDLIKISDYLWEIPKDFRGDMRVAARVFTSERMISDLFKDRSLEQLVNVAALPGIQKWALAMPDIHEGYGFPIGGVAAMDIKEGVISPGGIGYDINCGVRLLRSSYSYKEIKEKINLLANNLYHEVPSGVGKGGRLELNDKEFGEVLSQGSKKMAVFNYVAEEDGLLCESGGCLDGADPDMVSKTAKSRGRDQLGTIGAGNHFIEIQRVDKIFNNAVAAEMGLFDNQIVIMIHCGSRGLGHQVATDYIRTMISAMPKYGISLPDIELACAPFYSNEGQNYWKAMSAAANFAWANRQMISWEVREAWRKTFGVSAEKSVEDLKIVYDVAHNLAKREIYNSKELIVHRKGATRSFPPGHLEIPDKYKKIGQPVFIPGSMGTASFILAGRPKSMELSFGSTCHGAGRTMSRTKARRMVRGSILKRDLENQGIVVRSGSLSGLAEEAPAAYKDVEAIVDVVDGAGLATKAVRLKPVAVIKG